MQSSFEFRGLHCFPPATDERSWSFLPSVPDVQRGADRRPLLTLIDLGTAGYLMFTASWSAPYDDVEALRREIASRSGVRDPDLVRLAHATVDDVRCSALAGDGQGELVTLATSSTSNAPPYDALFNLNLRGERLEQARAALRGERGCVGIRYSGNLRVPAKAKASLHARTETLNAWLRAHGADAGDPAALERAVAEGAARIVIDAPDPYAGALAPELHDRVLARAAEMLPRLARQDAPGDAEVTVTLEQEVHVPAGAYADIGALVSAEPQGTLIGGHHAAD